MSYTEDAIAVLPEPDLAEWRLGRYNPAFRRGTFERYVFESLFRGLSKLVKGWAHEEGGAVSAYVIKKINLSRNRLSSIATALTSTRRAYEMAELTVIKYWYDPAWKVKFLPCDLILAEFPVSIPVRFRLDSVKGAIATDILPSSSC